jgi:hypothetical protein
MDLNVWAQRVRDHLAFLQQAGANPQNFDHRELVTSIHLYRLLLPFVFEYGEKNVWLPENVLFVFHCHLMRPASFAYDCQKSFKSFVRFNPHADKLPEKARNFTKGIFFARYGFAFDEHIDVHLADVPSNFSPTEDLIAEALKLRQFTENASSYSGILDLVEDSLQGYLRFFECVSRGTLAITRLPSLAVDIIWHTHLWYNEEYILFSEERTRKLIVDHREPCARGLNFARIMREKNYVVVSCSCYKPKDQS